MKKWISLFLVWLFLSGCSAFTKDNYTEGFKPMYEKHAEEDSKRIIGQANAIAVISSNVAFSTPVEAALYRVIAVQAVRDIKPRSFNIQAPTTGYDVFNTIAGGLPMAVLGLTSYGIAKKGYQYGGSTSVEAQEMHVTESFNRNDTSLAGTENNLDISQSARPSTTSNLME